MKEKQLNANVFFTIAAFMLSLGINFYITPIISKKLGDAAFGFVGMANDFVTYASIIAAVFNSVAARFISLEIHQGNIEKANKYYASIFLVNIVISIVIVLGGFLLIQNLEHIFEIPLDIKSDVKITFGLTFFNYIIVLVSSVFTVCTYVTNRLDIAGIRNIISYLIRFIAIYILFNFLEVKMYYIVLATILSSIFLMFANIRLTEKLLPSMKLKVTQFDIKYIKILAMSGIWMAFSNLSQVLMTGLNSIITNTMLGAEAMGIFSISKTIPNAVISAISTLGIIFTPNFVTLYAKGEKTGLINACKQSIEVMSLVLGVPVVGIIVFGGKFYALWLPYKTSEEIAVIQILSILMMIQSVFNMLTISIAQLSVVTNKLKVPVVVSLLIGLCNIIIVIVAIKYTNWGLYAVAGVSSLLLIVRYLIFNPVYAASCIEVKISTFYSTISRQIVPLFLLAFFYIGLDQFIRCSSWTEFFVLITIAGGIGYLFILLINGKLHNLKKSGEKNDIKKNNK